MAYCTVFECSETSEEVRSVGVLGGLAMETVVCGYHADRMDDGHPWYWDQSDGRFLMGEGLRHFGVRTVVGWSLREQADLTSAAERPVARLTLQLADVGQQDPSWQHIMLTPQTVAVLRSAVEAATEVTEPPIS